MRLVSWNIMAGGGGRCAALVDTLLRYDADVLVLQETLPSRGPDLCHALKRAGYRYGASAPRGPGEPRPMRARAPADPPAARALRRRRRRSTLADGWSSTWPAPASGWPRCTDPAAGPDVPAFWNAAAAWLPCRTARPYLMLGDYNAGASRVDAEGYRFKAGPAFAALGGHRSG